MLQSGEYLQLIQDTLEYLKQNPAAALSSAEDCTYYRQAYKASCRSHKFPPLATPPTPQHDLIKHNQIQHNKLGSVKVEPSNPEPTTITPISLPAPVSPSVTKNIPPPPPSKSASVGLTNTPKTVSNDSLQWPILPFGKWKTLFAKIAPEVHILSEVPNDTIAKKIATRWKTKNLSAPITLLCYQEIPEQKALLEQIAIALDVHFVPAKLVSAETIEKEGQWETFLSVEALKLVITCDYTLWQMPGLLKFYKEANPKRLLGEKELFLLPDLSLYLKDPLLKRSLWKALCQICEPLLPPSF